MDSGDSFCLEPIAEFFVSSALRSYTGSEADPAYLDSRIVFCRVLVHPLAITELTLLDLRDDDARYILRRLEAGTEISAPAATALRTMCRRTVVYRTGCEVALGSERGCLGLVSGWACRQRSLPDGRRQIFSFLLPGDIVLPTIKRNWTETTSIVALTPVRAVLFEHSRATADAQTAGQLSVILANAVEIEVNRLLDHIVRLGCQSALQRVMHLFREFDRRLAEVGLSEGHRFALPVQQAVLADALGLSNVHINRTLQQMRQERMIENVGRCVRLLTHYDDG